MDASRLSRVAPHPASEVEWEELLVRFELMPRALRVALEEVGEARAGGAEAHLRALVAREARVAPWLLALADGDPRPESAVPARVDGAGEGDGRELADRFMRLRGRNFAMLQRRGVEVWGWEGEFPGVGRLTVHQLLALLVDADARLLAALRAGAGAVC